MDSEDIALNAFLLFIFLSVIFLMGILVHATMYGPIVADNAQEQCVEQGYNTYDEYKQRPFDTKPYGLKCNHIKNKYEVDGNGLVAVNS